MCRGFMGIKIGEFFFLIVGEQCHTLGYVGRLGSGHIVYFIFCCALKSCTQKFLLFVYILIRWEGVIWI